jgi:hypothetical protein
MNNFKGCFNQISKMILSRGIWKENVNFIDILCAHFLYESLLSSFSLLRIWLWTNFHAENSCVNYRPKWFQQNIAQFAQLVLQKSLSICVPNKIDINKWWFYVRLKTKTDDFQSLCEITVQPTVLQWQFMKQNAFLQLHSFCFCNCAKKSLETQVCFLFLDVFRKLKCYLRSKFILKSWDTLKEKIKVSVYVVPSKNNLYSFLKKDIHFSTFTYSFISNTIVQLGQYFYEFRKTKRTATHKVFYIIPTFFVKISILS